MVEFLADVHNGSGKTGGLNPVTTETEVKTKTAKNWLPADEQRFYDSCVHGLRMGGWSRIDAEGEALNRLVKMRSSK